MANLADMEHRPYDPQDQQANATVGHPVASGNGLDRLDLTASNGEDIRLEHRRSGLGSVEMMPKSPFAASSMKAVRDEATDQNQSPPEDTDKRVLPQRMVSWQDDVMGRELVTVREFEPSEAGHEAESPSWQQEERKSCCAIM